mmetsp:Transcript_39009/g.129139  ORF Transcript_39009/g.129139 Transcript_39009/m.129139 type:complete len:232 (+) Transcript_39009:82-777(+)
MRCERRRQPRSASRVSDGAPRPSTHEQSDMRHRLTHTLTWMPPRPPFSIRGGEQKTSEEAWTAPCMQEPTKVSRQQGGLRSSPAAAHIMQRPRPPPHATSRCAPQGHDHSGQTPPPPSRAPRTKPASHPPCPSSRPRHIGCGSHAPCLRRRTGLVLLHKSFRGPAAEHLPPSRPQKPPTTRVKSAVRTRLLLRATWGLEGVAAQVERVDGSASLEPSLFSVSSASSDSCRP